MSKSIFLRLTWVVSLLFSVFTANAGTEVESNKWWDQPYPDTFDVSKLTHTQARIKVVGNQLVKEGGKKIVLQGLNISDPDKLLQDGHWNSKHWDVIKQWGANVVRVPVHPSAWRSRGEEAYLAMLDQAVTWANERGLYLIIDWHSIGNLADGLYQHPMYHTDLTETKQFWRTISHRYQGVPTMAVYEIFNEPTRYNGQLGQISWEEWKAINEEIISIIRAHDTQVIPAVAGFNWAYDLTPVKTQPIDAEGIAYVAHPYPQKTKPPYIDSWENTWGFVAKKYPLIATEIGFVREDEPGAHMPVINNDGTYGPIITDYLAKIGAGWTVWVFDPNWGPMMIKNWQYEPTEQGEFFRAKMRQNKHR